MPHEERLNRILSDIRALRVCDTEECQAIVAAMVSRQPSHIDYGTPMALLDCALALEDTLTEEQRRDPAPQEERIAAPVTVGRSDGAVPLWMTKGVSL